MNFPRWLAVLVLGIPYCAAVFAYLWLRWVIFGIRANQYWGEFGQAEVFVKAARSDRLGAPVPGMGRDTTPRLRFWLGLRAWWRKRLARMDQEVAAWWHDGMPR